MEKMESQGLHLPCLGQRCPILISFSLFDYYVSCTLHPSTPPLPHSSYFIIYNLHVGCQTVEYHYNKKLLIILLRVWLSYFECIIPTRRTREGLAWLWCTRWSSSVSNSSSFFWRNSSNDCSLWKRLKSLILSLFLLFNFLMPTCHQHFFFYILNQNCIQEVHTCSFDSPSLYVCFDAHIVPTFSPLDELHCSCTEEVLVPVVVLVLAAFYIFVCLLFFHEIV